MTKNSLEAKRARRERKLAKKNETKCPNCGRMIPKPTVDAQGRPHSSDHMRLETVWVEKKSKSGKVYQEPVDVVLVKCQWSPPAERPNENVNL